MKKFSLILMVLLVFALTAQAGDYERAASGVLFSSTTGLLVETDSTTTSFSISTAGLNELYLTLITTDIDSTVTVDVKGYDPVSSSQVDLSGGNSVISVTADSTAQYRVTAALIALTPEFRFMIAHNGTTGDSCTAVVNYTAFRAQ